VDIYNRKREREREREMNEMSDGNSYKSGTQHKEEKKYTIPKRNDYNGVKKSAK
jgi:hypothetical protein